MKECLHKRLLCVNLRSMQLGKYLHRKRKNKGYTLQDLANLSGCSKAYLCQIESGNWAPNVFLLLDVCKALGCSYSRAMGYLASDIFSGSIRSRTKCK